MEITKVLEHYIVKIKAKTLLSALVMAVCLQALIISGMAIWATHTVITQAITTTTQNRAFITRTKEEMKNLTEELNLRCKPSITDDR